MASSMQKTVLVGVTGCIAAYKTCEIIRCLQNADIHVKVVMSEHATHFINPLTFRALTHEPVAVGLFDDPQDPIHHISLAQEADVFLIAPCTANVLAKIAVGIADDLLSTTALATTAPVVIAPAMNVHMYEHAATQHNMTLLKERGVRFIEPESGYLACGDRGKGRLANPEDIAQVIIEIVKNMDNGQNKAQGVLPCSMTQDYAGRSVMITAGPTIEPLDPVRYISNRSSGKFGYAIAQAAQARGAKVTLISGPVALACPDGVDRILVETAKEMLSASEQAFETCDLGIFTAAVADVRPLQTASDKLKKGVNDKELQNIALVQNPDILATLAQHKTNQIVVGFAAETTQVLEHARKKLVIKGADMIVANEVGADKTFGKDDDEIWLVTKDTTQHLERAHKTVLANKLLDYIAQLFL